VLVRPNLLLTLLLVSACGDDGPNLDEVDRWRLTSANGLPLPAPGNATGGEDWAAGTLQFTGETGTFSRCMRPAGTSDLIDRPTAFVFNAIGGGFELHYFERRANVPDTARLDAGELTLRYRNVVGVTGEEVVGVDILTFVPQPNIPVPACDAVQ
jgi:hypothetical protein